MNENKKLNVFITNIIYFLVGIYVMNRVVYNYLVQNGKIGEALLFHPYLTLRYGKEVKI
jgi:hypothetical protein